MQAAKTMDTNWLSIGRIEDIPVLGARVVETAHGPVAVFRNSADEIFALLDRCPHQGGPLSEGMVHGRVVTCPLHAWHIHLDKGEAKAPDVGCVPKFEVRLEGDEIHLNPNPIEAAS
ncbi:MAG: nitrite reductase small subunit NirD [Aquisalimonadaceae bacterium]